MESSGLGLLKNRVDRFTKEELTNEKIPHTGFNSLYLDKKDGLFLELPDMPDFYFVHSYRMLVEDFSGRYATCRHGVEFMAAFEIGNICGAQFHPEKSQTNGLIFLRNFLLKSLDE